MGIISEIIAESFIRSWFSSVILHIGAGLRYGYLRLFRRRRKVSYKNIRYSSSEDLVNGFFGFLVLAVIIILIAK